MEIWQAIILGAVQGVAEFLPISSSGHLVLGQHMFGVDMEDPAFFTFDIVVHVGSFVAIAIAFWRDIWALIKNPFSKMTGLLIVGTIPAVIAGLFFRNHIEMLRNGLWLAAAFTVTGFLLMAADRLSKGEKGEGEITYMDALFVGVLQALALPPGISRSGTTITGALYRGISREAAAKYSFMLAMIAIAGAGALEAMQVIRGDVDPSTLGLEPMLIGFFVSLIVGYFSIRLLLKLIKACKLMYFSYYVWALAGLIVLDLVVFNLFF